MKSTPQKKYNMQREKKLIVIGIIIGLVIGIIIGVFIQQTLLINGIVRIGESWEGVISNMNIEIDLNETVLVEETYKLFPGELDDTT